MGKEGRASVGAGGAFDAAANEMSQSGNIVV
jgi:hypothetical protein